MSAKIRASLFRGEHLSTQAAVNAARRRAMLGGFMRGLAQMGSFGTARPMMVELPKADPDALRKDWERLGEDMTQAIDKVRDRGEEAA